MLCNKPNVVRQVKLEKDSDRKFFHVICPAGYENDVDEKY
jgi:hypothetical protein